MHERIIAVLIHEYVTFLSDFLLILSFPPFIDLVDISLVPWLDHLFPLRETLLSVINPLGMQAITIKDIYK